MNPLPARILPSNTRPTPDEIPDQESAGNSSGFYSSIGAEPRGTIAPLRCTLPAQAANDATGDMAYGLEIPGAFVPEGGAGVIVTGGYHANLAVQSHRVSPAFDNHPHAVTLSVTRPLQGEDGREVDQGVGRVFQGQGNFIPEGQGRDHGS